MLDALNQAVDMLIQQGVAVEYHTSLVAEPTFNDFEEIVGLARDFKADCVAGVGGGSVMDVAKMVAALIYSEQKLDEVVGIRFLTGRSVQLICVPTTSGTGSEMSPNAILLDQRDNGKKGIISPFLVPDAVYIDPLLTVNLPADITAYTGLDALTHCIEAYCNKFAHPMVDLYALEGIRLIGANLVKAVKKGDDVEARTAVSLGSMYGGMCLGPVNTAAVHALAYPLGSEFKMAHGLSNALLLPFVMAFNMEGNEQRYAEVATALGVVPYSSYRETALAGINWLKQMMSECNIPAGLSAVGVNENDFELLADGAMKVQRLLNNNLRVVEREDAIGIYKCAF